MRKFSFIGSMVLLFLFGFACKSGYNPAGSADNSEISANAGSYQMTFKAQGNEPGWKVITTPNRMVYSYNNGQDSVVYAQIQINNIMDVAGISYTGITEDGKRISLQVFKEKCSDTMADKQWDFRCKLSVFDGNEETKLTGCGEFLEDGRLEGNWGIKTYKGKPVAIKNKNRKPTMNFDTQRNAVGGNMGCNGVGGSYELMENKMYFSPNFMSTQMYCEGVMELEKDFTQLISGHTLKYSFVENTLVLTKMDGEVVMTLLKE
tara:strand:+ start:133497 stop:134282 length:786 start_codon:yes stop_codon:yes gene_type:complete